MLWSHLIWHGPWFFSSLASMSFTQDMLRYVASQVRFSGVQLDDRGGSRPLDLSVSTAFQYRFYESFPVNLPVSLKVFRQYFQQKCLMWKHHILFFPTICGGESEVIWHHYMNDNAKSGLFGFVICLDVLINNKTSSADVCWNFQRPQAGHTLPWPYSNRWPMCCSKT